MPEENDATKMAEANATEGVEGSEGESKPTAYDELKSFLEARNVKSPDDFSDFMSNVETAEHWKKQYGNSQNQVGELRRQLEAVEAKVNQSYDGYGEQPVTNLNEVVEGAVERVFGKMQKTQQEQAMRFIRERQELMSRPGWKDVQPHFDKAVNTPNIQFAIQNGDLTQEKLYSQINERVLMSRVNSFVEQMPQGALNQAPPNAETSDRTKQPLTEQEGKRQRINKAKDDMNVDALLKELIPDDDPIVKF